MDTTRASTQKSFFHSHCEFKMCDVIFEGFHMLFVDEIRDRERAGRKEVFHLHKHVNWPLFFSPPTIAIETFRALDI
jgi:hypothetical protein